MASTPARTGKAARSGEIAARLPDPYRPSAHPPAERQPLIAREAVVPGSALALASVGYATVAAFVILHLDARGVGHGATAFGAFATMHVRRLVSTERSATIVLYFSITCSLAGLATLTHTPSPMGFLREICRRPSSEKPILLVPVGYPADDCLVPDLRKKPLREALQWNRPA